MIALPRMSKLECWLCGTREAQYFYKLSEQEAPPIRNGRLPLSPSDEEDDDEQALLSSTADDPVVVRTYLVVLGRLACILFCLCIASATCQYRDIPSLLCTRHTRYGCLVTVIPGLLFILAHKHNAYCFVSRFSVNSRNM